LCAEFKRHHRVKSPQQAATYAAKVGKFLFYLTADLGEHDEEI
jgi:hypothetical protein